MSHSYSADDPELISVIDNLPLWAAPFGLRLLDTIILQKSIRVFDVGCGLGFPLIEVAQRLGNTSTVYGIDPWEKAIERAKQKVEKYALKNVLPVKGVAENLPFENSFFHLIVSNNGINNVEDMGLSLKEISRVSKDKAQFVFTMNLEDTMIEFYSVFENVLRKNKLIDEITKMKDQIYSKRKPINEVKNLLESSGFKLNNILHDKFYLKFVDAETMFSHSLIKYWFLPGWKKILPGDTLKNIFEQIEIKLNDSTKDKNEICLSVPYVTINCFKG